MSNEAVAIVEVSWNQNNTFLVKFDPHESTWDFPKNNKLKLFNMIHYLVSEAERKTIPRYTVDYDQDPTDFPKDHWHIVVKKLSDEIGELLIKWVNCGDLIIKK